MTCAVDLSPQALASLEKREAEVLAAPVPVKGVDRSNLLKYLAELPGRYEVEPIEMPHDLESVHPLSKNADPKTPHRFPVVSPAPYEGKVRDVNPEADEDAAIRQLAKANPGYGELELWGTRDKGKNVKHFWATVAQVLAIHPDAYTLERQRIAGVTVNYDGRVLLLQRFGVRLPSEQHA